jgi:hypothetical protein
VYANRYSFTNPESISMGGERTLWRIGRTAPRSIRSRTNVTQVFAKNQVMINGSKAGWQFPRFIHRKRSLP